jgi:hypothetical protein
MLTVMTQPLPLPGWYPDPSGVPGQRYWDGQKWGPKAPAQQQPQVVINNTNTVATPAPVYVATGPNHALHAVLSLFTCGAWLPIWIIIAIVDAASRPRAARQSKGDAGKTIPIVLSAFVLLLILCSTTAMSIAWSVVLVGGWAGYLAYRRVINRRAEQDRIAARADAEYRASLEGNPAGTYGQYPPPPLPEPDQWPPPNLP